MDQVGETDNDWDKILNDILDQPKTEVRFEFNEYCLAVYGIYINGVPIWIANYPFAYGGHYAHHYALPKRRTRERLNKFLKDNGLNEFIRNQKTRALSYRNTLRIVK